MTLRVELVAPDGEIWSGRARMVIAKTLDGDLGVLTGHPPVLGILAEGSLIQILDPEDSEGTAGQHVLAAVSSGFLAVADDRVSIMSRQAQLGSQVDTSAVQAELDAALAATGPLPPDAEPAEVKYARALLRAAGERS
ncbi:MAG TPA: F0F1 ATP synthase subunit epsilon [Streptosporangiaceae bacterium]|nr:F0F1 ATP synthase subunit epsilon [Streptosporangiaceae bacterium]